MDRAVELFTRSPALRKGWTDARVAYAVGCQWRAAQNGLRHIVAFGAMLLEVERWLAAKKGKFKRAGEGYGLKAWLSEHCPEVNYNTAAGYKAAALGLRNAAKLAADRPLLPLMGEKPLSDEEEERVREKVMDVVATSSLRLLKEASRAEKPGPRKATHTNGRRALAPLEIAEAAMQDLEASVNGCGRVCFADGADVLAAFPDRLRDARLHLRDCINKLAEIERKAATK